MRRLPSLGVLQDENKVTVWKALVRKERGNCTVRSLAGEENRKGKVSFLESFSVLTAGCGYPTWAGSFDQQCWCLWYSVAWLGTALLVDRSPPAWWLHCAR